MNFSRPPPVEISAIGTKGGDFKLKSIFQHNDDTKVRADGVSPRKNLLHFFRARVGRDIESLSAYRRGPDRARSRRRSRPHARRRAIARPFAQRSLPWAIVLFSSARISSLNVAAVADARTSITR